MLVFLHLRVSSRVSGFPVASPCLYGGSCKICTFRRFPSRLSCCFACLFDNVSKMSKLEDVSHEMLVFLRPRVSSRVSGFPVASACLWGKLQNVSFSKVSKQVVMLFSVAGMALCDIPTCLITCRKCQTWRKSRTKCLFFCTYVSRLESLVFLWRRRVYGESCKMCTFRRFPSRLSCCFACLFDNVSKMSKLEDVSHEMLVFLRPRVSSRVSGFPVASACLWGKLQNVSFSKVSKQVVMLFSVAGMALCDIPTCLITCRKCQNWRKSRTKCLFFAPTCFVSNLWFSCGVGVSMGKAAKCVLFEGFQAGCQVVLHQHTLFVTEQMQMSESLD